jgi:hypothetical protein
MTCGLAYCMKHELVHALARKCPQCSAEAEAIFSKGCIKCHDPHMRCFCCSSPTCHDPDCIGLCRSYMEEIDSSEWNNDTFEPTPEVQNTSDWSKVVSQGLVHDKKGEVAALLLDRYFPFWVPAGTKETRRMNARRGIF